MCGFLHFCISLTTHDVLFFLRNDYYNLFVFGGVGFNQAKRVIIVYVKKQKKKRKYMLFGYFGVLYVALYAKRVCLITLMIVFRIRVEGE